jgi:hypothetical protein
MDDGLVRQLATTSDINDQVIHDNRDNRIIPLEFSVIFLDLGHQQRTSHLLPPNPPLSLESVYHAPTKKSSHSPQPGTAVTCVYMSGKKKLSISIWWQPIFATCAIVNG